MPVGPSGRLGDKVNSLNDRWERESRVRNQNGDPLSDSFVKNLEEFFAWIGASFPRRREVARQTIRELGSSQRPLPAPIEDLRAAEWMEIRNFFVASTHHGSCSEESFDTWLELFELFVLGLARPPTFDNADRIDALVHEVEAHG